MQNDHVNFRLPPPSEDQAQDPHILRAIGRAWGWRRRMEVGEFATIQELAEAGCSPLALRACNALMYARLGLCLVMEERPSEPGSP